MPASFTRGQASSSRRPRCSPTSRGGRRWDSSPASLTGITLLGTVLFLALGCAIGSAAGSIRSANIIIWSAFTPMIMLSDLFLPVSTLPGWLQAIAKAVPLTPVVTLLRDTVYGLPVTDQGRFAVIGGFR